MSYRMYLIDYLTEKKEAIDFLNKYCFKLYKNNNLIVIK